jgi:hypothetical protein
MDFFYIKLCVKANEDNKNNNKEFVYLSNDKMSIAFAIFNSCNSIRAIKNMLQPIIIKPETVSNKRKYNSMNSAGGFIHRVKYNKPLLKPLLYKSKHLLYKSKPTIYNYKSIIKSNTSIDNMVNSDKLLSEKIEIDLLLSIFENKNKYLCDFLRNIQQYETEINLFWFFVYHFSFELYQNQINNTEINNSMNVNNNAMKINNNKIKK